MSRTCWQIARLAEKRASEDHFRAMARNNVTRQEPEIARMRSWLSSWYGDNYTRRMTEDGQRQSARLSSLGGNDFDNACLVATIKEYQKQNDLSRPAVEQAQHPQVKELAASVVKDESHLTEHLKEHLAEASGTKAPDHDDHDHTPGDPAHPWRFSLLPPHGRYDRNARGIKPDVLDVRSRIMLAMHVWSAVGHALDLAPSHRGVMTMQAASDGITRRF